MENKGADFDRSETESDGETPIYRRVSESVNGSPGPEVQVHRKSKCFRFPLTVEPLVFAVFFADALAESVTTNFILWRTCRNHFHFNKSTCDELALSSENKTEIEALIQPYSSAILTGMNFISICLPAVTSLFLGPWSDYNGRKLVLILPSVGHCLKFIILGILNFFPNLGPEYALLSVIPVAMFGGFVNFISAAYSYVSDISSEEKRFFRITMVEVSLGIGIYIGLLIVSSTFKATTNEHFTIVYGISTAVILIVMIPTHFFLPESVPNIQNGKGILNVFELKLFKEMLEVCFRKREGGKRIVIFLSIACLTITLSTGSGNTNVLYLFTRLRFGWNIQDFTFWASISLGTYFLGPFLGVMILSKWLKIPEPILGMLSYASQAVWVLLIAFIPAHASKLMYYVCLINLFGGLCGPICRALLSKSVSKDDLGKVFALTSSSESFFPLIFGPLYTVLYNSTLHTVPSAFLLLSGSFYILCWIFFVIIFFLSKKYAQPEFNSMENTSDSG